MSKINKIKAMLQSVLAQFAKLSTDKGLLTTADDEIVVGSVMMIVDDEGNESKPEDGEYKSDEGMVYVIADGKVTEIKEVAEEAPQESEEAEEEKPQNFSLMHRMAVAFESFLEKEDKIRAGLVAKGIEGWLVDAGDDFVVVGVWQEDAMQDKFWKYGVSWDEEGNAVIGDGIEVKSEFVPVESNVEPEPEVEAEAETTEETFEEEQPAEEPAEPIEEQPEVEPEAEEQPAEEPEPEVDPKDEQIANLQAELARVNGENDEFKTRIAELEKQSAAPSAEEEFERVNKPEMADKRLNKLSRILGAK